MQFRKALIVFVVVLVAAVLAQPMLAAPSGSISNLVLEGCTVSFDVTYGDSTTYFVLVTDRVSNFTSFTDVQENNTVHYVVDISQYEGSGIVYVSVAEYLVQVFQIVQVDASACLNENGTSVSFFDPGDARINRQAYANVAIYCDGDNSEVDILRIIDGVGVGGFSVPYANLVAGDAGVIASGDGITFERTGNGTWLVNGGAGADGKVYLFEFDACTPTWSQVYVIENGVVIPTETNTYSG